MTLEQRIRSAEADLFHTVGADVDESFLDLTNTGARVRLLSHGRGPPLVLLHGVSLSAAAWVPLFAALSGWRVLAVEAPSGSPGWSRSESRQSRSRASAYGCHCRS
jgi:pimeloyl-ACP methyl ester carboxylesterase